MAKTVNLVLSGGGVKGISLVGAIVALEEAGYQFARVAGTSAGAIVGGLLAAGYDGRELAGMMREIPYQKFRDESLIDKFGLPGKFLSLLLEKGVYEGDYFCHWYDELLEQKGISTFADLKQGDDYRFVTFAADITAGKLVCFPRALEKDGISPAEQHVSRAVRASVSIPFFYEPVMLNGHYLVDGGILSNFPIDAFEGDDIPTIGIKLSAGPGAIAKPHTITGPISYAAAVMGTMLSLQDQIHLDDPDVIQKTIFVDTGSILATDLDLNKTQQQSLFDAGQLAAKKYIAKQR